MWSQEFSSEVDASLNELISAPEDDERWRNFHGLVKKYVGFQVRNVVRDADAEDVSQDVFTRVFQQVQRGGASEVSNSVGWLKRICLCAAVDYRRRREAKRRYFGLQLPFDELTVVPSQAISTPDQLVIFAENTGRAIAKLSANEDRLYRALAKGPEELGIFARESGISQATLAVRIARLRSKLVKCLVEVTYGEFRPRGLDSR